MGRETTNPFRLLPSVEEVLGLPGLAGLEGRVSREVLVGFVQELLGGLRAEIGAGSLEGSALAGRLEEGALAAAVRERIGVEERSGLRRSINATGVVLHTGLGRAPVHPEAARRMEEAARSFCTLEIERETGERGQRDRRLGELLRRLTGAEEGIAVNNNAAAVLLLLNTFAQDRETVVSRGELVEIGGSFRMPAIMERAGTRLVEVGTTNRTRATDYRKAVGPRTGLLLKVHTSNFRQVGFTEEVSVAELAALASELEVPSAFDLGSGLFEPPDAAPLPDLGGEPPVRASVDAGVDVVTFSGDKLLGGPQAGLVVGKAPRIRALRANPLYRALRLDKVTVAGLEETLELYLAGRADEIPARALLRRGEAELAASAAELARALDALPGLSAEVGAGASQPGSGSAPGVELPGPIVRVRAERLSAAGLAARLRAGEPPVFARIHEGLLQLDPRTLLPGDAEALVAAFRALAG